jgi:predicted nuclease of predicted toxin-antitoxin system
MKVLLDECVPRRLKTEFSGVELSTVPEAGWAGKKNGELLSLAEKDFDVFITVDQNLQYQQKLTKYKIAVILISPLDTKFYTLKRFLPQIKEALKTIQERRFVHISA